MYAILLYTIRSQAVVHTLVDFMPYNIGASNYSLCTVYMYYIVYVYKKNRLALSFSPRLTFSVQKLEVTYDICIYTCIHL